MSKTGEGFVSRVSQVSCVTFLSRVSGLIRDMLWASAFGTSVFFEAFLLAFKIPNMMRRLFAEGAFSQAFVPILSQQSKKGLRDEKQFIGSMLSLMSVGLGILTLLVCWQPELFITILTPGIDPSDPRYIQASRYLRVTFPFLWLMSLSGILSAVLNQKNKYALPAFLPIILNVFFIAAALLVYYKWSSSIVMTVWSVVIAGVVQLLLVYYSCVKLIGWLYPCWHFKKELYQFFRLFVASVFGASVTQINVFLDTIFISYLPIGSLSWLYFADRILYFPMGVFAVSMSTVALTRFSQMVSRGQNDKLKSSVDSVTILMTLITSVVSVGLLVLAFPLSVTFFYRGHFTQQDVINVYQCLQVLGMGLPAMMMTKVLTNLFYANGSARIPVQIGLMTVFINLCLNIYLIPHYQHIGLAMALTTSSWFQFCCQTYYARRFNWLTFDVLKPWVWMLALAILGEYQILQWLTPDMAQWYAWSSIVRAIYLLQLVAIGLLAFVVTIILCIMISRESPTQKWMNLLAGVRDEPG